MSYNYHYVQTGGETKQYVIQCKDYKEYLEVKKAEDARESAEWDGVGGWICMGLGVLLVFGVIGSLWD